jgi:hypothetical protein
MLRTITTIGALAALALPATAAAGTQPTPEDRRNAAQECRAERGTTAATREAFAVRYGTNANRRNAFGRCVSQRSRDEQRERTQSEQNAPQRCRALREQDRQAFDQQFRNFGACVSQQARRQQEQADEADQEQIEARQNAARQCRTERGTTEQSREAFAERYGTNENDRNAFGRCVSQRARAQQSS